MPSYYIKSVIKDTAVKCAIAAVPGAFVPGIDLAAVGGLWVYMMNKIADEHNITFDEEPIRFVGTIAAGVGAYWTGSKIFTYGIGIVLAFLTFGLGALLIPVTNVILNAYFTWSVGRRMDAIFSANSGEEAGYEIAKQIIKAVCHVPGKGEFSEFWDEVSLSVDEIKNWFNK
jgi:hypothetical protein